MAIGAKGVVSVATNVVPHEMHEMAAAALAGDFERARTIHFKLLPLMRALFQETNPIPVKQACAFMRKCTNEVRMPLIPMSQGPADRLHAAMKELRLL
jgi:4-hydroxy-tetrahydrodipicolinate synthase